MLLPQAFLLDSDSAVKVMQLYPVVEERLWRVSGIRMALQLLPQLPDYQVGTIDTVWERERLVICISSCLAHHWPMYCYAS